MKKFEGVIPALVTPLNADETVRVEVLQALIEYLLKKDADGFYIGGATGEGLALRREQRMILAEEAIRQVGGRAPCIVQVAATDFGEAIALAKHAEAVGADAISATPPLFFGYGEEEVYQYYKTLAEAVHIPMMIYYNPAAGFTVNADFAARMFEVDNITAITWTSSDYYGMLRLKDLTHGEMNILNGPDEMLLMGLTAGADGGIGTTYNFQLDTIRSVYTGFRAGDLAAAQAAQTEADRAIAVLKRYAIIPATKALLAGMGFAVGDATFPMKRYSDAEKQEILSAFRALGFSV